MPYSCIVRPYVDTRHKLFQPANRKRLKFNIMHAVSNPLFYCISWPLQLTIEFGLVSEQYFSNLHSISFCWCLIRALLGHMCTQNTSFFSRLSEKDWNLILCMLCRTLFLLHFTPPVAENWIWAGLRTVFLQSRVNMLSADALFLHR
jgi:hypothetical protein